MDSKRKRPEGQPSKAHRTKRDENPVRVPPTTGPSLTWNCMNRACRAERSIADTICTRCSCCICNSYDVHKQPSLWLECAPDAPAASCGLSCHIECAIRAGKVRGSYCCASCGQISGIFDCLKKQLIMAKDARRVGSLYNRLYLSCGLSDGYIQDLHEIVKEALNKLKNEVGPLDKVSANQERGHGLACKLDVAEEVENLCAAAVKMADRISAASLDSEENEFSGPVISEFGQMVNPNTSKETGLKFIIPDLNIDITGNDSSAEVEEGNDCDNAVIHEYNFEYCVTMIRRLECEKHFTSEVRRKLVTWLAVKTTEGECRMLNALIQAFIDNCALLNGTSRFQGLLEIVKEAKVKLESEVGSLDELSSELAHRLERRFSVVAEVEKLCAAAVRIADELSATLRRASVEGEVNKMIGSRFVDA